jgi:trk system potassium uptake protein TrkH
VNSSSATAVATTLNVIGPGLGQVGASENYAAVNDSRRSILTLCMLLGRLGILTMPPSSPQLSGEGSLLSR